MRNVDEFREAAIASERIFLPNRYQDPFVQALQSLTGIEVPEQEGRKLTVKSNGKTFNWIRGRDIPKVLAKIGCNDAVGFTGSEWCLEYSFSWDGPRVEWTDLDEKCIGRVALVAPRSFDQATVKKLKLLDEPVEVVTVYPNYVTSLKRIGLNIEPAVGVNGCVEGVAKALNMPAVDLVSTGETLRENGFSVVRNLVEVYPAIVISGSGSS